MAEYNTVIDAFKAITDIQVNDLEEISRKCCIGLFNRVIDNTPVLTGALRASMTPSIGTANTNIRQIDENEVDPTGDQAKRRISDLIAQMKPSKDRAYLTSALPYTYRIEFLGWSHTKAPGGMFRISADDFPAIVHSIIN